MIAPGRPKVVWFGDQAPEALVGELGRWGMSIANKVATSFKPHAPDVRAVLVPFQPDEQALRKSLAHATSAADAGALIAVTIARETDRAEANRLASETTSGAENRITTLNTEPPHVIARRCADHDPGPAVNEALRIDDPGKCLSPAQRILLSRAFGDFHRLEVRQLAGGRSAASGVWRVTAYDRQDWECEPFAVKGGLCRAIKEEIRATLNNVAEYVPFPHRPPLAHDRCVEGIREALIVSMFVDRVTRFEEYILLGSPSLAVSALFDGPLRTWRRNRKRGEQIQLGTEYTRCGVLPKAERVLELDDAYQAARRVNGALASPTDLLQRLAGKPKAAVDVCFPHGDLHTRNIFVRRNSSDVILIDFAGAKNPTPAARDLANLDVAIAFDVADKNGSFLSAEIIRLLYQCPLLPLGRVSQLDGRVEALARLRSHALGEGISAIEYEMTVACYMLAFARYPIPIDTANRDAVRAIKGLADEVAATMIG